MAREKLKVWAKKYGIKRLAGDLGVHQSSVYGWIKGNLTPSTGHCVSILGKAKRLTFKDLTEVQ